MRMVIVAHERHYFLDVSAPQKIASPPPFLAMNDCLLIRKFRLEFKFLR